jgi:hypothetical protein
MKQQKLLFPDTGNARQEFLNCSDREMPHFSIARRDFPDSVMSFDLMTPWYQAKLKQLSDVQRRTVIAMIIVNSLYDREPGTAVDLRMIRNNIQNIRHHHIPLSNYEIDRFRSIAKQLEAKGVLTNVTNPNDAKNPSYAISTPAFEAWYKAKNLKPLENGEWSTIRPRSFFDDQELQR